ncbi:MFS transporter [Desulfotomaculum nigrificans]|uniref:MFS transporter n=1 Tax=Desulfotomaculum nigrificans TaxID=1565 RepID=UPI0001FAEC3F|nr:MFS transporter [Desulfotomaculum nigrificans]
MLKSLNLTGLDYILVLLLLLTEFTRSAFFLTFWPLYAVNFLHLSVVTAGVVVSAHYLSETLVKGAVGYQLDRRGRPVLIVGLIISFLSLISIYLLNVKHELLMVLSGGLFGLGFAPVWLAVMSQVAPIDRPDRAGRIGLVFSAWLIGAGAGPVGINFILPIGFRPTFQILILLWLTAVLLVIVIPFRTKTTSTKVSPVEQFKKLARNPMVVKVLLPGMFLQTMAASLLLPVLPIYATKVLGLASQQYGLLLTAGGAATVLFLVPMGRLVDRLPLRVMLTGGFLLSAIFLAAFPLTKNLTYIIILVLLVGGSYAMVLPAWNSLLARAIPAEHQATGWGIFTTLEGLGIATGPTLGGVISGYIHPVGTIYLSAIILGGMGIFYLFYPFDQLSCPQE